MNDTGVTLPIQTIDLDFQGVADAIAVYLVPHKNGAALVESGPASTLPALEAGLRDLGYSFKDITDVFLTHIHLDHAGASGQLARQGICIHVHPVGAPHLIDPSKLLSSASRIYGDAMDRLWGQILPVPPENLSIMEDDQVINVGGREFRSINTPGHAEHHYGYMLDGGVCFTGDIGGVRLPGAPYLRLPMPPPELNIEKWRQSLDRLRHEPVTHIIPTHYGIYRDVAWHLDAIEEGLDEAEEWLETVMLLDPPIERLRQEYIAWINGQAARKGIPPDVLNAQEAANPSFMSADGLARYWKKVRNAA